MTTEKVGLADKWPSSAFARHSTQDLRDRMSGAPAGISRQMEAEIARREGARRKVSGFSALRVGAVAGREF